MKDTCDLCPRLATRWYVPGDDARCGLHERSEAASVPLTRRPPPPSRAMPGVADLDELRALRDQAPTVRPPADERCPRCSRILIAAPCSCLTPVDRAIASGRAHRANMNALTTAQKLTVWRVLGVEMAAESRATAEGQPCT